MYDIMAPTTMTVHDGYRELRHPAADRWADLVWAATSVQRDPRTLADWAKAVGLSVPTLRTRCYLAGVSPRSSLALARLVRAVHLTSVEGGHPSDVLDTRDPRTLRKLLLKARLEDDGHAQSISAFLEQQELVKARLPIASLRRLVHS
jgi:hypothetical protein